MSYHLPKHIIKKNLGKAMIYFDTPNQPLLAETERAFQQIRSYTKPETIHMIQRKLEQPNPGKQRIKYWEDVKRYSDQRKVGFFVCSVLAKRKISIPLR